MDEHFMEIDYYAGSQGERPEPWQKDYACSCGEEFGFEEEGSGGLAEDPWLLFEEHLRDLEEAE